VRIIADGKTDEMASFLVSPFFPAKNEEALLNMPVSQQFLVARK